MPKREEGRRRFCVLRAHALNTPAPRRSGEHSAGSVASDSSPAAVPVRPTILLGGFLRRSQGSCLRAPGRARKFTKYCHPYCHLFESEWGPLWHVLSRCGFKTSQ
jgi:hypothetical protein